jgi:hypothetical protein
MSAIPICAARLPATATLLVLDPIFGPVKREVGILAPGEDVLVEAASTMCFRKVIALREADPPRHMAFLPRGAVAAESPSADLVLDAMQPIGEALAGSPIDIAERRHDDGAQPQLPHAWFEVEVEEADRLIVNRVAIGTGPLPEAGASQLRAYAGARELDLIDVEQLPGGMVLRFDVPPRTTTLRLISRHTQIGGDHRRLGVAILRLQLEQNDIPLDSPSLVRGFHDVERNERVSWRWTDGNALIILPLRPSQQALSIQVADW